jgi:crotonobetainyl-CoA:carnitine CoA-transferase CaiB-like acyl-CoA transferase
MSGRMAGFSRTQHGDVLVPSGAGEHSTQILHEAGLGEQAIRNLVDQGVVCAGGSLTIPAVAP